MSPWSRSSTPPPKSPLQKPKEDPPALKQSSGLDHTISLRPSPSLRRYPKDCPPLKTRWFYAVDVAKRKPFAAESSPEDKNKPPPVPKKFVPFSSTDSQAIEKAYQSLDDENRSQADSLGISGTKVPVNEDFLFDVHIEKRELEPAYWLGPVYEIRRGSWFYADSSPLKPCDENLANQLEEGYLKLAPWRKASIISPRSTSQPRSRPDSVVMDGSSGRSPGNAPPSQDDSQSSAPNTYRLFGAHMNTTVTYQDATVAYLSSDDFISRMSSTVYGRFVGYGGTKIVRGWSDAKPADPKADSKTDPKAAEATSAKEKRKSAKINPETAAATTDQINDQPKAKDKVDKPRRSALERQISSLAGMSDSHDSENLGEEEAREQEEKEMEDAREKYGDEQARQIDHLVLVTHGIGQRLGLRLDSINFIHDVNTLRKTMKAVYKTAPDLQALSGDPKNCRVQVLPICWRHLLDFPKQSLKQNRKELDLGDADAEFDDEYPSLQDITVEGVPAVRNLITDLAMDVLLYQSAYREHIASIVQKESNRVYQLFKERTGFSGKVSFCGHSLGSAIIFDILCRQEEEMKTRPRRVSSKTSREPALEGEDLRLDFDVENFFCLGSPIALFQMLKGRTIAGRQSLGASALRATIVPTSPFDPDPMRNDPFDSAALKIKSGVSSKDLIPITTSSPKCNELFNIFHPTDPIAYRMEPLISPAMAQLKSQPLPYTRKALFGAPGIANISTRVGQQVMSSWYNLTSGVASSLINKSLGITGDEQALPQDKGKATTTGGTSTNPGGQANSPQNMPVADEKRQQDLADAAKSPPTTEQASTLIDSELETLYSGFQQRQRTQYAASGEDNDETAASKSAEYQLVQERARKLKREEAKVRALNSNGRVDYHIQEGMFDVSLLASIASHLSYWADEDVNHFMIGQMLKTRGRDKERDRVAA
ncbi:uncharacterized protein Z518_07196 [Rhinocladiella mackenziei CBS 650.93]|uniref:DDHD domain-containing protein n=1 Tax=Rhinocladiella mackenziei CBS 650.93 TaxID=1442369 RepID=A0A0D2GZM4_9EURO|nr:uncharacterized protein Z518_07196 [Rhinocladiella mackenziei CBS 650.93]KIX03643.1 hypothetical protein Z518_07196 [Rhinocladiella mackenziei CBS 650.93]